MNNKQKYFKYIVDDLMSKTKFGLDYLDTPVIFSLLLDNMGWISPDYVYTYLNTRVKGQLKAIYGLNDPEMKKLWDDYGVAIYKRIHEGGLPSVESYND